MTWILKYWKPLLGGVAVLAVIYGEVQYGRARYQAGYDAATAAITAKMISSINSIKKLPERPAWNINKGSPNGTRK